MSSKHVNSAIDLDKGYEENYIGLKGIVYFGVGLLLLIIITFVLMWALLYKMREVSTEYADPANPMAMTEKERLPPEPRLQAAPGFGVDSDEGRVNLELTVPASEYLELKKQWHELIVKGRTDPKTGVVTSIPVEAAIDKLLASGVKTKSGPEAASALSDSKKLVSDSSAGRLASDMRR